MNKKQGSLTGVYVIIFVIYSIMFFAIPFPKAGSSWISYLFSVISIGVALAVALYAFGREGSVKSKLYGFPIFKVGNVYCIIQLAVSGVMIVLDAFVEISLWIVFVVSLILLGITAIGLIATVSTKEIIEAQEQQIVRQTNNMTFFRVDAESITALCQDPELKKSMEQLCEKLKYSDPVSSDALVGIENTIKLELELLRTLVVKDKNAAMQKSVYIQNLLEDRNRRCKATKR